MAGISSKAAGTLDNKKKFNGIEHTTDLEINTYDALFRTADPQIGRWWQIDPKPNVFESPYSMMGGNPISKHDFYGDTPRVIAPIIITQKTMPNVYKNHLNYLKKHPDEAIRFGNLTMIVFDYEPDKRQQEKNRRENKRANPVNNTDPSRQEDEVAPASTKQGGARGVRMAVPAEENASHGGQIGAAIKWLNMGEGDVFLTVLIPGSSNNGDGALVPTNVPNFSPARTSAKQSGTSRTPSQPSPANSNPVPLLSLFRMTALGAAIQAAMNTIMIENMSHGQNPDPQMQ